MKLREKDAALLRIAVRTDASITIGTGHVMRCLTLADSLRSRKVSVFFVCRELTGNLCDLIEARGYDVSRLPAPAKTNTRSTSAEGEGSYAAWLEVGFQEDAEQTRNRLKEERKSTDWLIVDHYALDTKWESRMRPLVGRIMAIDDLADRMHDCDLLLDQSLCADMKTRYDGLVPSHCTRLLGPRYALLRPEFARASRNRRKRDGAIRRLLIFFGGIDPTNETARALEAVKLLNKPDITVDVVVGAANPRRGEISDLCASMPNAVFHCQVSNMAELMTAADLAIGAAGVAAWERISVGLPSLVITIADNQETNAGQLSEIGALRYLGRYSDIGVTDIARNLKEMFDDRALTECMRAAMKSLVDASGTERVVQAILDF